MDQTGSKRVFPILAEAFLLAFAFIALFFFTDRINLLNGEQWPQYYTILSKAPQMVEKSLDEQGISFISLNSSDVSFNNIPEMVTIPLARVSVRFEKEDPRYDPYLKALPFLFKGTFNTDNYDLIYVEKKGLSPFRLWRIINSDGDNSPQIISGFQPLPFILPSLIYIISSLILCLVNRDRFWISFISRSIWLPLVFLTGYPAAVTALFLHYLVQHRKSLIFFAAGAAVYLLFQFQTGESLPLIQILFFLSGLTGCFLLYFTMGEAVPRENIKEQWKVKIRFSKPDHDLFEPTPIISPSPGKAPVIMVAGNSFTLLILCLTALFILALFPPETPDLRLPLPHVVQGLSWTLEDTGKSFGNEALISSADYLVHRAFQEGLLYRSRWDFPSQSDPLILPIFDTSEKVVSKSYKILTNYNDKWFAKQISLLNNNNPATLLFSTVGPVIVEKKQVQSISPSFSLLIISHFMLTLLLLLFSNQKIFNKSSFSVRKKLLRRNEQVA